MYGVKDCVPGQELEIPLSMLSDEYQSFCMLGRLDYDPCHSTKIFLQAKYPMRASAIPLALPTYPCPVDHVLVHARRAVCRNRVMGAKKSVVVVDEGRRQHLEVSHPRIHHVLGRRDAYNGEALHNMPCLAAFQTL